MLAAAKSWSGGCKHSMRHTLKKCQIDRGGLRREGVGHAGVRLGKGREVVEPVAVIVALPEHRFGVDSGAVRI